MTNVIASPAATGPGGAHFEAKVGAFYLLAMLLDAEPRGLPGARIEKIQFQGAGDGFPLDDVIVHATSFVGDAAVLEIQAKHKITFSPSDPVFEKVAGQIAEAFKAGKLDSTDVYELGIATAQNSRKIDGAYQEVLSWAKNSETPDAFFRKLGHLGVSNADMRTCRHAEDARCSVRGLTESEIKELCQAAPALAPLLADNHPAHDVVRNLFRLDRLARQPSDDPAHPQIPMTASNAMRRQITYPKPTIAIVSTVSDLDRDLCRRAHLRRQRQLPRERRADPHTEAAAAARGALESQRHRRPLAFGGRLLQSRRRNQHRRC